jgi:hypothetical protein
VELMDGMPVEGISTDGYLDLFRTRGAEIAVPAPAAAIASAPAR